MSESDQKERFSRQVILPGVGSAGQQKWAEASFLLAGEGVALEAVRTALLSSGAGKVSVLDPSESTASASLVLVVTENSDRRRILSRQFRKASQPALFAWAAGSGYALFLSRHLGGCPCLECFETLNPKAFSKGQPATSRILGALAASEALQWVLKGESPIEGKVWITSLEEGVSFHHEVQPTYKCPARLMTEGAPVTP